MAKYGITAVDYDINPKHIKNVQISLILGDRLGSSEIWSRNKVISTIENLHRVITVAKSPQGIKTADVRVVHYSNGEKYIRSVPDTTTADNLGNLPSIS